MTFFVQTSDDETWTNTWYLLFLILDF